MKRYRLVMLALGVAVLTSVSTAQDSSELLRKAGEAIEEKEFEKAIDLLSQVLAKEPKNSNARFNRAYCYLATDDYVKAEPEFTATIELMPTFAPAYLNRGVSRMQLDKTEGAIEDFSRALDLDSTLESAYYMRGSARFKLNEMGAGAKDYVTYLNVAKEDDQKEDVRKFLHQVGYPARGAEPGEFSDDEGTITIALPKDWHSTVEDDGKKAEMTVAMQKPEKEGEGFTVGARILKVRRLSKSYNGVGSEPAAIATFWTGIDDTRMKEAHSSYKSVSSRVVKIGNWVGVIREVEWQHSPRIFRMKTLQLIVGHDDTVVSVSLDAPADYFALYKPMFERALGTVRLD